MKQSINLLPVKVKKTTNWLAFNHLLIALLFTLVCALVLGGFFAYQTAQMEQKLAAQQQVNYGVKHNLSILNDEYTERQRALSTANILLDNQQHLKALQQMQSMLIEQEVPVSAGFINTLKGVQAALPKGAQLESIKISQGQQLSYLRGVVPQAVDLTVFVDNLRNSGLLVNQQFKKISSLNIGEQQQFEILSAQKEL